MPGSQALGASEFMTWVGGRCAAVGKASGLRIGPAAQALGPNLTEAPESTSQQHILNSVFGGVSCALAPQRMANRACFESSVARAGPLVEATPESAVRSCAARVARIGSAGVVRVGTARAIARLVRRKGVLGLARGDRRPMPWRFVSRRRWRSGEHPQMQPARGLAFVGGGGGGSCAGAGGGVLTPQSGLTRASSQL